MRISISISLSSFRVCFNIFCLVLKDSLLERFVCERIDDSQSTPNPWALEKKFYSRVAKVTLILYTNNTTTEFLIPVFLFIGRIRFTFFRERNSDSKQRRRRWSLHLFIVPFVSEGYCHAFLSRRKISTKETQILLNEQFLLARTCA